MKLLAFLIAIAWLSFLPQGNAQYTWTGRLYKEPYVVSNKDIPGDKINFKGTGGNIVIYIRHFENGKNKILIKRIDLSTLRVLNVDTADFGAEGFDYCDVQPIANREIFIGSDSVAIFDHDSKRFRKVDLMGLDFSHSLQLNDTLVLLYSVYNYHPVSGTSGIHLGLLNLKNDRFIRSADFPFPGIVASVMGYGNWITAEGKNIYIVTPFTGRLIKFDLLLKPVDTVVIPLSWANPKLNTVFENKTDSMIYSEWNRISNNYKLYGQDSVRKDNSLKRSIVFTKDYIGPMLDSIHHGLEYIEKVMPLNDSIILITVSKPYSNPFMYREIVSYNFRKNSISKRIAQWRTGRKEQLATMEDFFCVDVANDAMKAPYFIGKKVYTYSSFRNELFQPGAKDSLQKILYLDTKKNDYSWRLLEYSW